PGGFPGGFAGGAIPGQNCLGFNQFNGGLGAVGSTMNQGLILLIQQLVAPGEWGQQQCLTQFPLPGVPGILGGPGGLPGQPGIQPGGGGPPPNLQNSNTIGFYAPALALVVRGTSRIHTKQTGGVFGDAKPKENINFNDPQLAKNNRPP